MFDTCASKTTPLKTICSAAWDEPAGDSAAVVPEPADDISTDAGAVGEDVRPQATASTTGTTRAHIRTVLAVMDGSLEKDSPRLCAQGPWVSIHSQSSRDQMSFS